MEVGRPTGEGPGTPKGAKERPKKKGKVCPLNGEQKGMGGLALKDSVEGGNSNTSKLGVGGKE